MPAVARSFERDAQVIWRPQLKQLLLIRCPVFEILFGGARGGGKSDGMLGDFANHAQIFATDAIGLLVRRELTQLKELIERSRAIYTPLGADYNVTDKMWRFPNGARLTFAYLDNDADADKYQGASYSRIYVEEMGNFPDPKPIFKLMAAVRSANPKVQLGFRATANPGGPGHLWIKRRYIDPSGKHGMRVITEQFQNPFNGESINIERVFIPSKITDNRYTNNASYIARLQMSGGAKLVRAWLHGDWEIIEGAFFEEWDPEVHVIKQFIIPDHWPRLCSMDWGSSHPFSIGWWAIVPDDWDGMGDGKILVGSGRWTDPRYAYRNDLPRGAMVRYREWYGSKNHDNNGLKLTAEEVAAGINQREVREPHNDDGRPRISLRVAGKDLFAENGGPSLSERMSAEPYYLFWQPADNSRVARKGAIGGWDAVRNRLIGTGERDEKGNVQWTRGKPMIYFFENCIDAARTLPAMQHDKDNFEDVETEGCEDHLPDEVRYACMSRPYTKSISVQGPDRIMTVGPDNELRASDVFDIDEGAPKKSKSTTFQRIK